MSPLPPAYAHVLGLGLLWTSIHCASMCGPLLCGLQIGGANPNHKTSVGRGVRGVLTYQAGRGLTYAWLGGLAGLIGAGLGRVFTSAGGVLSLLFGAALIFSVVRRRSSLVKLGRRSDAGIVSAVVSRMRSLLAPLLMSTHPLRELVLGAMMGFLPCMIPAWALGQAALTGSPFHGAAIMLLLVLLTTPVLLVTTQLPRLGSLLPQRLRSGLAWSLPAISGIWLLLIGGAGLALWPHQHLGVSLFGHPFLMMLF
jgi:sulfite exporter TauE/SafE